MRDWMDEARELLDVIERRSTRGLVSSAIREQFRDVLAGTDLHNYLIMHYQEPRAVLTSVETFEAMRRLALLVASVVGERETPAPVEPTSLAEEAWENRIEEALRKTRQGRKSGRRGQQPA